MNSYGTWQVTTEGDCERRTTRNLGIYEGTIEDIAFHLADKAMYTLEFAPVQPINVDSSAPTATEVDISLRTPSWDKFDDIERLNTIKGLLRRREIDIVRGRYYNTVCMILGQTPEQKEAARIATIHARAVAKLTDEERQVLGIK